MDFADLKLIIGIVVFVLLIGAFLAAIGSVTFFVRAAHPTRFPRGWPLFFAILAGAIVWFVVSEVVMT